MTSTSSPRNYAIDWIKGLMMITIVVYHTSLVSSLHHGYLAVDLFFPICGYFLMMSFTRKPTTAILYTWNRVKRFYLPFLLCFLLSCILRFRGLTTFPDFDSFLEKYAQFAYSFTLSEEIGPRVMTEHILHGSWFLSVMLVAGFLMYGMLEYNKKLTVHILFPAIYVLGFTLIFTHGPMVASWDRLGAVSLPLLRGLAGMVCGALIYDIFSNYKAGIERRSTLINLAFIVSSILFLAIMFAKKALDLYLLPIIPWILLGAVIEGSWFNRLLTRVKGGFVGLVGRNTIYLLFAHPPCILLVDWTNEHLLNNSMSTFTHLLLDLVLSALGTIVLYYVCRFLRNRRPVKK